MSTSKVWMPSGIDFETNLKDFRGFTRVELAEAEYVERLQICGKCSMCRNGKCLSCGACVWRKALTADATCPQGRWPALDNDEPSGQ